MLDFDEKTVQENFEFFRARAERSKRALADDSGDRRRAYTLLRSALNAAGLARALQRPASEVHALLEAAAEGGAALFAGGAPDEDEDTSASSPGSYVDAVHAALAAGGPEQLETLAAVPPEGYRTEQVEASPELEALADALRLLLADDVDGARAAIAGAPDGGDRHSRAQLQALERLLERDREGYDAALRELVRLQLDAHESRPNAPERFLRLPALGLEAAAVRLGLSG